MASACLPPSRRKTNPSKGPCHHSTLSLPFSTESCTCSASGPSSLLCPLASDCLFYSFHLPLLMLCSSFTIGTPLALLEVVTATESQCFQTVSNGRIGTSTWCHTEPSNAAKWKPLLPSYNPSSAHWSFPSQEGVPVPHICAQAAASGDIFDPLFPCPKQNSN